MRNHYKNSVGNGLRNVQITTKYRYNMMRKEALKIYCKVAIEEACKKHKIEIVILRVLPNHVHVMVDIPRTMSDSKLMQIVKGLSSYLLFRICPNLRKRYPKGHFWNGGYFCEGVGVNNFDRVYSYIEKQEEHHGLA
jgi:putative transposase